MDMQRFPKAERDRWGRLMEEYFSEPELITFGIMIVDARHKPTADDITMANWFKSTGSQFVVVANKIDKVKKSQIDGNLSLIRDTLELSDEILVLPFSAETGENKNRLISEIEKFA